ncbi:hypothetical protein BOTBODRAFT_25866 [Botryobasidium botryosum FD-172 SS1]|uniref:N-acetyltransferase domain-containing protein n=1 Tax=Botryobasidium botryosum (strain FD-172 SS1) TaxID=930990 RepID=A0A067NCD1_BOTB1|nr:hypothetical protein BOTBODRAFT_25866 [Botryobasidium botryosum FD-172 SS1]
MRTPPRISLSSITPSNLGTLRKLNSVIFPVKYSERFYKDVLLPEAEDFCKLVYYNDLPVGTICCRIERSGPEGEAKLYIMTMGVLAPYRSRSLGSEALKQILASAASSQKPKITHVYLHVQVSNDGAKRFYERQGFVELKKEEGYYKKIEPRDAWVLERKTWSDAPA